MDTFCPLVGADSESAVVQMIVYECIVEEAEMMG